MSTLPAVIKMSPNEQSIQGTPLLLWKNTIITKMSTLAQTAGLVYNMDIPRGLVV